MGHGQRTERHPARLVYLPLQQMLELSTALVMIVSYETLRTLTAELANCQVGLLLCDEGHRLKNSGKRSL